MPTKFICASLALGLCGLVCLGLIGPSILLMTEDVRLNTYLVDSRCPVIKSTKSFTLAAPAVAMFPQADLNRVEYFLILEVHNPGTAAKPSQLCYNWQPSSAEILYYHGYDSVVTIPDYLDCTVDIRDCRLVDRNPGHHYSVLFAAVMLLNAGLASLILLLCYRARLEANHKGTVAKSDQDQSWQNSIETEQTGLLPTSLKTDQVESYQMTQVV